MPDLAGRVLDIAAASLTSRAMLNSAGDNEGGFLDPLRDVVATGMTPADRLLAKYHDAWGGDVSHIYEEFSFSWTPTAPSAARFSPRSSLMRRATSMSVTATASIGSCAAIATASPQCSSTA